MPNYLSPGVYVEEVSRGSRPIEGVGTAVAAFVGLTQRVPDDDPQDPAGMKPRHVTNWSQFQKLYGGFIDEGYLPHAVYGFFNNGGGSCYICPVAAPRSDKAAPRGALPAAGKAGIETLEVRALEDGARIEVVVEASEAGEGGETGAFILAVRREGQETERYTDLTFSKGPRNVESVVNQASKQVRVKAPSIPGLSATDRLPTPGRYALEARPAAKVALVTKDFEGSESERTGVRGLVIAEEVTMVCIPDLVTAATKDGGFDMDLFKAVQTAAINHCEGVGDRMAILDPPPALSPQKVKEWREATAMYDSKYAALYYPWVKVAPANGAKNGTRPIAVPPCGHIAGIWARNDDTRGVWKAPANEVVRGALDLEVVITKGEQDLLNPMGVNCIRPFGIRGIRVWGARTMSSDAEWRYVNVRRLFNYIEQSILRGTQWVVFEPNDMDLWERVKRTISAFLLGLWRQGALFGATPEQAFYVKCDEETNPPESIDEGKLVVEVGVAPVKPAEFVIFRISQWQGGSGAAE
jgi:uncharacterized protein